MAIVITAIHVIACLFLIGVVLLQQGKGADMGAVFGGSSSTIFGSSGAGNFLSRLTTGMAIVFMLTSLGLTYLSGRSTTATVFDSAPPLAADAVPAADVPPLADAPPAEAPPAEAPPALNPGEAAVAGEGVMPDAPAAEPQAAVPDPEAVPAAN